MKRFGILIDSYNLKHWQYYSILQILENTEYKLAIIVLNNTGHSFKFKYNNALFYFYKKFLVNNKQTKFVNIQSLQSNYDIVKVTPQLKGKFSQHFSEKDIEKVRSYNLDFLLRFGFGILRGEILKTPKYGVWSFHHGDEQKYRGGPYCFWEIYKNDPVTGAILQRLTNKLDGGIVLRKGYFKTQKYSFNKNIEQSLHESSFWPMQVCKDIGNGIDDYIFNESVKTNAPIYKIPINYSLLKFSFKVLINKIRFLSKYFKTDLWNVGYIQKELSQIDLKRLDLERISWLNQEKNKYFLADPFPITVDKKNIIFAEKYEYLKAKGDIIAIDLNTTNSEALSFSTSYHYSYPFTFKKDGKIYQVKESYQENEIALYSLINLPDKWHKESILITDFKGIDSTLFEYNDKWWLFTTEKGNGHSYKLFIFYSDDLIKGKWNPHANNPVKMNIRSGRCAGNIMKINNQYYRPAQNYSITHEGSVTFNRIVDLNEWEYKEEEEFEIKPLKNSYYNSKIHTISSNDSLTTIDACKTLTVLDKPNIFIKLFIGKLKRIINN